MGKFVFGFVTGALMTVVGLSVAGMQAQRRLIKDAKETADNATKSAEAAGDPPAPEENKSGENAAAGA